MAEFLMPILGVFHDPWCANSAFLFIGALGLAALVRSSVKKNGRSQ